MSRQRGNAFVRMHADGGGVQDGIEGFLRQRAARNGFPADSARQLLSGMFAPGADRNLRSGTRQGKSSSTRRAARPEDQHAAAVDAHLALERTKHTDVICVAAVERAIAPDYHGVYRANFRREWFAFFQMFEDGLFVRDGDAESFDSKVRDGF